MSICNDGEAANKRNIIAFLEMDYCGSTLSLTIRVWKAFSFRQSCITHTLVPGVVSRLRYFRIQRKNKNRT